MLTRRTPADAATYALSLIGRSRDVLPVPWTDSRAIDDCARFCSHVLWGGFPISWVDNFKTAGDGSYARGSSDLQPWDVLLFDWDGNGVGNHVEFMVADLGDGTIRTYGANGSDTRKAAYRIRPKRYVLGRFRPAWHAAPIVHTNPPAVPAAQLQEDSDMITIRDKDTGHCFALGWESVQHLGRKGDPEFFAAITTVNDEVHELSHAEAAFMFDALSIPGQYLDAKLLRKERPNGHWSRQIENNDLLRRLVAKVGA